MCKSNTLMTSKISNIHISQNLSAYKTLPHFCFYAYIYIPQYLSICIYNLMYVGLTHDVHLHLSVLEHVHVETTEMGTTSMTFTSEDIYTPQYLSLCKTRYRPRQYQSFIYTPQYLSLCKTSNPTIQFSESWMSLSEVHLSLNE